MIVFATVARKCNIRNSRQGGSRQSPPAHPGCLWTMPRATLGTRNDRCCLIRVSALLGRTIYGRGYVVVGLAGDDRAVGVCGRAVERGVDHCVRAPRYGAAVDVVADGTRRGIPGEVHGVLRGRRTGARDRKST